MDNAWTSNGDLPPKQKDKAIYLRIPVELGAAVEVEQVSGLLSGHFATKGVGNPVKSRYVHIDKIVNYTSNGFPVGMPLGMNAKDTLTKTLQSSF